MNERHKHFETRLIAAYFWKKYILTECLLFYCIWAFVKYLSVFILQVFIHSVFCFSEVAQSKFIRIQIEDTQESCFIKEWQVAKSTSFLKMKENSKCRNNKQRAASNNLQTIKYFCLLFLDYKYRCIVDYIFICLRTKYTSYCSKYYFRYLHEQKLCLNWILLF